jgi:glycosyltransferase involved in cell wall biosynthesis
VTFPRITLVTPSFNQSQFLEATIQSVLGQDYPNLEYIIMDGGSTDNSVQIIKRYAKDLTYWQSKTDGGQSEALRQGFARATGVIMNWVNSDDLLAPGALDHIASLYQNHPNAGIFAASTEHFTTTPADAFDKVSPRNWRTEAFLHVLPHESFVFNAPGAFFTLSLYERIGGLNPALHMCMDYDLFLRMCETKPQIAYSSRTTAFFRHHPASKTTSWTTKNVIHEHAEYLQIFNNAFRRTGLVANRLRSVNLLHWLLFHAAWHADLASTRLAYRALRQYEGSTSWGIAARICVLFRRRLLQPPDQTSWGRFLTEEESLVERKGEST